MAFAERQGGTRGDQAGGDGERSFISRVVEERSDQASERICLAGSVEEL